MRFALVDNERVEANPALKQGLCPICSQPVIAKCGKQRIHHWAHRTNKTCDNWWETETEWHRSWKSNFPADWQEVILTDEQTREKHIADVRTSHGLVIEFQHSHIDQQERASREKFYKDMIWIVDGTRRKNDYKRFLKGESDFRPIGENGFFFTHYPEEYFPVEWIASSVPVIFDFRGLATITDQQDKNRNILWCLLPGRVERRTVCASMSRETFMAQAFNNYLLPVFQGFMSAYKNQCYLERCREEQRRSEELKQAIQRRYIRRKPRL
jgi:hypothetical protein